MNIYIFSKSTETYAPSRIIEEGKKRGHNVENLFYKDLSILLGPEKVRILIRGQGLEMPDACILRVSGAGLLGPLFVYQRVALIDFFDKEVVVVNRKTYQRWPRLNKLEQHYSMIRAGIPVVPGISFSSEEAIDFQKISFPIIAKTSFGSSGRGVFKLNNEKEFMDLVEERGVSNLIFQKFLTTRQDYRVIVIGGQALPQAMRKTAQEGEFLTNFARGGKVEGVPLTEELKSLAEKTAEALQTDYAGVDVMYDEENNPYVLEINRGAQFQGFEQSTGINVAEEIVKYLEKGR
ncbi:MAG: RimK family alpha-L-glutamate ligase [Candidatus Blackburnbacteria bacterium]|nr:RimK family alpha-L-glutamate ligase [Candidatus Blackburnbacteria bacterium]